MSFSGDNVLETVIANSRGGILLLVDQHEKASPANIFSQEDYVEAYTMSYSPAIRDNFCKKVSLSHFCHYNLIDFLYTHPIEKAAK